MRLAAVAVGSAILGSSVVLFSLTPSPSPVAEERVTAEVLGGEPRIQALPKGVPVTVARPVPENRPSVCPPCRGTPLDAAEWRDRMSTALAPPAATWDRASVLSLAFPEHERIAGALEQADPAGRELAALLLNVASERIVGCSRLPTGSGTATDVLDALDRLVATVEAGEQVAHADLAVATAAARALNEGDPVACAAAPHDGQPDGGQSAAAGAP